MIQLRIIIIIEKIIIIPRIIIVIIIIITFNIKIRIICVVYKRIILSISSSSIPWVFILETEVKAVVKTLEIQEEKNIMTGGQEGNKG